MIVQRVWQLPGSCTCMRVPHLLRALLRRIHKLKAKHTRLHMHRLRVGRQLGVRRLPPPASAGGSSGPPRTSSVTTVQRAFQGFSCCSMHSAACIAARCADTRLGQLRT